MTIQVITINLEFTIMRMRIRSRIQTTISYPRMRELKLTDIQLENGVMEQRSSSFLMVVSQLDQTIDSELVNTKLLSSNSYLRED